MIVHVILGKVRLENSNGVVNVVNKLAHHQSFHSKVAVWGLSNVNLVDNTRLYAVKVFKRSLFYFFSVKMLRELVNDNDRKFHLHGGWNLELIFLAFVLRRLSIPYVVTPHGAFNDHILQNMSFLRRCYFLMACRPFIKASKFIHLFSERESKSIIDIVGDFNYKIIPNGIELSSEQTLSSIEHKNAKAVLVYCGRIFDKQKGVINLIHGLYGALELGCDVVLRVIGDGPDLGEMKDIVDQYAISDSVLFYGPLYGRAKDKIIESSDCFILTSFYEGMPLAALEAVGLGKYLILSESTNLGDYVRRYQLGTMIAGNSKEQIQNAIVSYCKRESRSSKVGLVRRSREMVCENLDWNIICRKTMELYE